MLSVGELPMSSVAVSPANAFAKTEVQHFDFSFGRHLHVGGFQVAVNDSFLVCGFECFGDLLRNGESFFDRNRSVSLDALCQRLAGHQLHDQIARAAGLFQPVDRGDVGMIQRRQHLRFALKTGEPFGIVRERFRQNFDGHVAPELGVVRLIHLSHAARANLRDDFVGAEICASSERHHFFPVGTFCFNSSNQFSTTLICVGAACACSLGLSIRKRWPSGDTS